MSSTLAQNYSVSDTLTEYPNKGTFYHDRFVGRKTASGEVFDQNKFTAAHWKIKLGTYVLVTNQNTGLQVIVKVNDRCPKKGVFDMTHRAAAAIGIRGCQPVTIRILPDGYENACAMQDAKFDSVKVAPKKDKTHHQVNSSSINLSKKENTKTSSDVTTPNDCYGIFLCYVDNHSDAYSVIKKLPDVYQDKVLVTSNEDNNELTISIALHLPYSKANELCRALKHQFPNGHVIPCD